MSEKVWAAKGFISNVDLKGGKIQIIVKKKIYKEVPVQNEDHQSQWIWEQLKILKCFNPSKDIPYFDENKDNIKFLAGQSIDRGLRYMSDDTFESFKRHLDNDITHFLPGEEWIPYSDLLIFTLAPEDYFVLPHWKNHKVHTGIIGVADSFGAFANTKSNYSVNQLEGLPEIEKVDIYTDRDVGVVKMNFRHINKSFSPFVFYGGDYEENGKIRASSQKVVLIWVGSEMIPQEKKTRFVGKKPEVYHTHKDYPQKTEIKL